MSSWIAQLAEALDVPSLAGDAEQRLLDASRDVAHRVERKQTPLSTFIVGSAVGAAIARGATPEAALDDALTTLARMLPLAAPDE